MSEVYELDQAVEDCYGVLDQQTVWQSGAGTIFIIRESRQVVLDREIKGTRGGSGFRGQTLAVKSRKTDEKSPLFPTWEIPRSESKAKDGEKRRKTER